MKKDSPLFKMYPGSKEKDTPTAFNEKDKGVMGAFNYGTPLDTHVEGHKAAEPRIKTVQLDEIILYGKDPKKKYKPSEVGGRDAGTGKTFKPTLGDPVI